MLSDSSPCDVTVQICDCPCHWVLHTLNRIRGLAGNPTQLCRFEKVPFQRLHNAGWKNVLEVAAKGNWTRE